MDLPPYGSPADRGSADYYYGRARCPHWYPNGTAYLPRIPEEEMTEEQIREYNEAYDNETDQKNWF